MSEVVIDDMRQKILLGGLLNRAYQLETVSVTYPCVDGSQFTLEIPVAFKADAVAFAQRSIEYQKAYNLSMHKWQDAGQFLMIVTTRFGTDMCLFSVTTDEATATLIPISKDEFEALVKAKIPYLDRITAKGKYNKTNVVSFPVSSLQK